MPFILSLDEGTTSARSALYDEQGAVGGHGVGYIRYRYPHPGWVEQDALEIWRAQLKSARRLLERARVAASDIVAAGITNQRETTVVWDARTGDPVAPAIVWQCRRTADYCAQLARVASGARDHEQNGPGDRRLFFRKQDSLDSRKYAGRPPNARKTASCCSATSIPG